MAANDVVDAYNGLARVERAFCSLKTVDLHILPIHPWLAPIAAAGERASIVAPAWPSPAALRKRAGRLTPRAARSTASKACCVISPPAR